MSGNEIETGDDLPRITTSRAEIEIPAPDKAPALRRYYRDNRDHLRPWEPLQDDAFYATDAIALRLREARQRCRAGLSWHFVAFDPSGQEVIGICSFTNVARGAFHACHLGYSLAQSRQGQGYMTEIAGATIEYMFATVGLHRIMANYIPENRRSEALLQRLGFEREGFARSYLKIAGEWRDHVLTSKINPDN